MALKRNDLLLRLSFLVKVFFISAFARKDSESKDIKLTTCGIRKDQDIKLMMKIMTKKVIQDIVKVKTVEEIKGGK